MDNRLDLYKQHLLDLAKNPQNYGLHKNSDFQSNKINPSCGDVVTIGGFIENNQLKNIRFEGSGCVLSLAMASLLTTYVQGMSIEQVINLDEKVVKELLKIDLGINRLQCGMLSVIALQQGLKKYID